jgi:hypothetical protein
MFRRNRMSNVKGIKLVTGEEVISEVANMPDGRLVLKNPVQLRVVPPQLAGAQPSMGFVPFPSFGTQGEKVLVEPLHIVYTYTPDEQIVANYNQMFGSGIITPSKQIITG